MVTTEDIQGALASYSANGIDLAALEDWIAQQTWNIHQSGDLAVQHLAYSVELLLAEHSNGDLSEPQLRRELSLLLLTPMVQFGDVLFGESRSSNLPVPVLVWQPWQRVGIGDGAVHA